MIITNYYMIGVSLDFCMTSPLNLLPEASSLLVKESDIEDTLVTSCST